MKRTLSLALVLCMVLALFAGCGGNKLQVETTPAQPQAPAALQIGILAGSGVALLVIGLLLGILIGRKRKEYEY